MTGSKVADAQIFFFPFFLQRRRKTTTKKGKRKAERREEEVSSRSGRRARRRDQSELPRCAANSLSVSRSFRGDTGTARRAPRLLPRCIKKTEGRGGRRDENIVRSYVKSPRTLRSPTHGERRADALRRSGLQVLPLRSAPQDAALMASVLGNSSRASGAHQSGQVKCKLKRRRRRRSKRKGTTFTGHFFSFLRGGSSFQPPAGVVRTWWFWGADGIGARRVPGRPRAFFSSVLPEYSGPAFFFLQFPEPFDFSQRQNTHTRTHTTMIHVSIHTRLAMTHRLRLGKFSCRRVLLSPERVVEDGEKVKLLISFGASFSRRQAARWCQLTVDFGTKYTNASMSSPNPLSSLFKKEFLN